MADSKRGKKAPAKNASGKGAPAGAPSQRRTLDMVQKIALTVIREQGTAEAQRLALSIIREHGLPEEIREDLLDAGVPASVLDRIGGAYDDHPHGAYGYKRKTGKKK